MKFYVSIVVHQDDSVTPDYGRLHAMLMDAGFVQRALDGTLTHQPTSGLYLREDTVLGRADVEFDLRFVLDSFPHRCSFHLDQAADGTHAVQARTRSLEPRLSQSIQVPQASCNLVQ